MLRPTGAENATCAAEEQGTEEETGYIRRHQKSTVCTRSRGGTARAIIIIICDGNEQSPTRPNPRKKMHQVEIRRKLHQIYRRLAGRTNREPIFGPMVARMATARDDCVISPNASKGARLTAHWMCQYTERHKNIFGKFLRIYKDVPIHGRTQKQHVVRQPRRTIR